MVCDYTEFRSTEKIARWKCINQNSNSITFGRRIDLAQIDWKCVFRTCQTCTHFVCTLWDRKPAIASLVTSIACERNTFSYCRRRRQIKWRDIRQFGAFARLDSITAANWTNVPDLHQFYNCRLNSHKNCEMWIDDKWWSGECRPASQLHSLTLADYGLSVGFHSLSLHFAR